MSLYRVDAIVIKTSDLGEADRLVTSYTRQRGRHRAVARGARRPKSRLAAGVQPFVYSEFHCWRGRTLDGISQCQVKESWRPLRESLEGMAAAAVACELTDAFAQEDDPDFRTFDLLRAGLSALAHAVPCPPETLERLLTAFQWKLLAIKGFRPVLAACAACGRETPRDFFADASSRGSKVPFSPAEGGLICSNCAPEAGDVLAVSRSAVLAVDAMIRRPLAAAPELPLPPGVGGEVAAVSRAFLTWVLEKDLRSRDFLDLLSSLYRNPPAGDRL